MQTDALNRHAEALLALAEILERVGSKGEADDLVNQALALYDRKKTQRPRPARVEGCPQRPRPIDAESPGEGLSAEMHLLGAAATPGAATGQLPGLARPLRAMLVDGTAAIETIANVGAISFFVFDI